MKALSPDLRHRIVQAYERGEGSQRAIAERFSVGKASVERLLRLKRETGALAPRPHGGGQDPRLSEADRAGLVEAFKEEPDLSQEQIAERFTAQGRPMSRAAVGRGLKRLAITRKKVHEAAATHRAGAARAGGVRGAPGGDRSGAGEGRR